MSHVIFLVQKIGFFVQLYFETDMLSFFYYYYIN
jgi:hypothetical protein